MSAEHEVRAARSLGSRPLGAIAVSLATVLCFTAALGLVFLPAEVRRLAEDEDVGVVSCHFLEGGKRAIVLTRPKSSALQAGLPRQVALHDLTGAEPPTVLISATFEPLIATVSTDNRWLFSAGTKGQIQAIDLHAPNRRPRLLGEQGWGYMGKLECTADGSLVVLGGAGGLCAWDTIKQRRLWQRDDLRLACWALVPNLRRCVVQTDDGAIVELDLQSGLALRTVRVHESTYYWAVFSSDARLLALQGLGGELDVVDFATGESIWPATAAPRLAYHAPNAIAFSPCGRLLVTIARNDLSSLAVWSVETGERLCELRGHHEPVTGTSFTQDGRLHSWGLDGTIRTWDCWAEIGTRVAVLGKRPHSREPGQRPDAALAQSAKEDASALSLACTPSRKGVAVHD